MEFPPHINRAALFLNHVFDLFHNFRVGQSHTSPDIASIRDGAQTRRMIFPDRVLGMSGTSQTRLGLAILPIWSHMASEIFCQLV